MLQRIEIKQCAGQDMETGCASPECPAFCKLSMLQPFWVLWNVREAQTVMQEHDWTERMRPNANNSPSGKPSTACLWTLHSLCSISSRWCGAGTLLESIRIHLATFKFRYGCLQDRRAGMSVLPVLVTWLRRGNRFGRRS